MEGKNKKCCPKCCQFYEINYLNSKPVGGNVPLFLSCGHTICENCVRTLIKCEPLINCPICENKTNISSSDIALIALNKFALYDFFPINNNMLGELILPDIKPNINTSSADDEYFLNITELIKTTESSKGECVECHQPTSKMCEHCSIIVCDNCFSKSHKNFVIFKNHTLQNFNVKPESAFCHIHKSKLLDYYCYDCVKAICMDCLMVGGDKSCKNHNITSIEQVNESMLSEVTELAPTVEDTLKRLTKTAFDIGKTLTRLNDDNNSDVFTKLLNEVEQNYSKLNAAIQKQKDYIVANIIKMKLIEIDSLNEAKYSVAESIQKAKYTLDTINSIDTKKLKEVNMSAVLKDAKEIVNTPWYLNREETESSLRIKINDNIIQMIDSFIQLEGSECHTYTLSTTRELVEKNVDIPKAPPTIVYPPEIVKDVRETVKCKTGKDKDNVKATSFIKKIPQYKSKMGSCSSLNSINSDTSHKSYQSYDQTPTISSYPDDQHSKQFFEGSQELIYISHIVDPHNFYIQRACHQSNIKEMLREFKNAVSMPRPSVSHVTEGKMYLVFSKVDNMWQRCEVLSVDKRNVNKPIYKVFCVDFGCTEFVTIDKLRLLQRARVQNPPHFAFNCRLANCEPINGSWTSEDSILIQNIIDNKQAVLHVHQLRSNTTGGVSLEGDVITVEHAVNVARALAFHGRARIPHATKYPKIKAMTEKPKLFMSNNDFKQGTVEDVYITHIMSPDHFYVRKQHLQSVYENLCEELDHEYSLSSQNDCIYLPEKDMVVVAHCTRWSRAVIRELPGRGRVRVMCVDTGVSELVHWTALRRLKTKFTVLRALATECHLAGVTPLNKKWSPASVSLLQEFQDKLLELCVEDNRNKNSLGVTLNDTSDESNVVCINTLMIKHKFAVSFGLFMFNKNTDMDDLVITNKSPLDEPKPVMKSEKKITILKKDTNIENKTDEKNLEAKDKGPLRLEAHILNYQSPSLLYVSLVHQQKTFNELFEKIQKYYTTKKIQGKNVWNVGDRCCTLCNESHTWRRAAILEIENDNAKVFYSDFACVETVPISDLRELSQEFGSVGDAAIMCHLCGVTPAVGDEWPSLTKEYLKELLDAYKRVFITKVGQFKGKSMPVELWVYHTIQGGALEPNKSEWRCLNKKIIDQGLGIPDKSDELTPDCATNGDDMLSFLNITGSVRDWLQIEPMPLKPLKIKSCSDEASNNSTQGENQSEKFENVSNSNTVFISEWLPPEPLPANEFKAMPTYIDNDGLIYLHDMSQEDTLDLIRKALDVRFKNPDPKAKFVKWSVGEPCVALYFLDNRFYRGKILAVDNEESTCLVHYIDYGNDEICAFENLRKSIALYQIPTQAHKCVLSKIEPVGKNWDRTTLDYIHRSIVEKICFVKVSGEAIGDLVPIELKYDKLWVNDHLVEFEMAKYTDGSEAIVRKYAPDIKDKKDKKDKKPEQLIESDSGPDYIIGDDNVDTSTTHDSINLGSLDGKDWNEVIEIEENQNNFVTYTPYSEREFKCTITVLNDVNTLELNIAFDDHAAKTYEDMFAELQNDSCDAIGLNGVFENKACVALFPDDGQWYRASILQYSRTSNRVKVKYVDYGNIQVLSLSDVREIDRKFVELPPANLTVTLHGVRPNPSIDKVCLVKVYEQTFLDKEPFDVKIIDIIDSVPSVELRRDGHLVYENLIRENIFVKCD
nr:RING finger protein 17 isoform X1 [Danaus plexippus plexippus]XP_032515645.1 RING finger protein 17 isoform X2 [Danaus plexippus plexippus]